MKIISRQIQQAAEILSAEWNNTSFVVLNDDGTLDAPVWNHWKFEEPRRHVVAMVDSNGWQNTDNDKYIFAGTWNFVKFKPENKVHEMYVLDATDTHVVLVANTQIVEEHFSGINSMSIHQFVNNAHRDTVFELDIMVCDIDRTTGQICYQTDTVDILSTKSIRDNINAFITNPVADTELKLTEDFKIAVNSDVNDICLYKVSKDVASNENPFLAYRYFSTAPLEFKPKNESGFALKLEYAAYKKRNELRTIAPTSDIIAEIIKEIF